MTIEVTTSPCIAAMLVDFHTLLPMIAYHQMLMVKDISLVTTAMLLCCSLKTLAMVGKELNLRSLENVYR